MSFQIQNKQFFLDLDKFKNQIDVDISKMQREIALLIVSRLVSHGRYVGATPVGNPDLWKSPPKKGYSGGRAISNWRVDVGGKAGGTTDSVDFGASVQADVVSKLANLQPYQIVWISNNLPYIYRIMEEGHSTQTPKGSIALTIAEVKQIIQAKYGA